MGYKTNYIAYKVKCNKYSGLSRITASSTSRKCIGMDGVRVSMATVANQRIPKVVAKRLV